MLVLSRKRDEMVVFPRLGISVEVVEIRGDKVRLGIVADSKEPVHRKEVWERILAEHQPGNPPAAA